MALFFFVCGIIDPNSGANTFLFFHFKFKIAVYIYLYIISVRSSIVKLCIRKGRERKKISLKDISQSNDFSSENEEKGRPKQGGQDKK